MEIKNFGVIEGKRDSDFLAGTLPSVTCSIFLAILGIGHSPLQYLQRHCLDIPSLFAKRSWHKTWAPHGLDFTCAT